MKDTNKVTSILKTIQDAGFPVGASYLGKQLNLAPATIGRVLSSLEEKGLVDKVSNKGRVLTERGIRYLQDEAAKEEKKKTANKLVNLMEDADSAMLLDILNVRKLLEVYTAEQACLNATDEELMNLEFLLLEHLHEIRGGGLGDGTDLMIHLAIAKASKSKLIYQILKLILTDNGVYTKFSYVSDQIMHSQIKQHDSIIQAIKARDCQKAGQAMESHLDCIMADVKKYYHESN